MIVNRVNVFSGNLNPGSMFTIGKAESQPLVQIGGTGLPTAPAVLSMYQYLIMY